MNQEQREHTSTFGRDGEGKSIGTVAGMEQRSADGSAGDVVNRLPASLWSDERDVQELRSMAAGGAGRHVRRDGLWMSEEDKKQAAMKTIAHLQEWATKQCVGSAEPLRGSVIGGGNGQEGPSGYAGMSRMNGPDGGGEGYGVGRSMEQGTPQPQLTQQFMAQHQQQQHYHQQQQQSQNEYDYAAVLQRIIQDHLSGKHLSVLERQLLQQYIQMEQQKVMAQEQAQQQAQQRDHEMAQRLYQEHLERTQMGRMHVGNGVRDNGMWQSLGGFGGMGEMDGMMNSAGHPDAGGMQGMGGMASSGAVRMGGTWVGGHVGDAGVIGGGSHPQSYGFNRSSGYGSQHYNGKYNAPRRQAGAPAPNGNGNIGRPKHGGHGGFNNDPGRPPAANPIQTLQEIGRTLSTLGITVEVAVNAGLLGGLSATDVRIVAEAHRIENELKGLNVSAVNMQRSTSLHMGRTPGHAKSGDSSPSKSPRPNSLFGNASAPTPSSPACSTGSLSNPLNTRSLHTGLIYSEHAVNGLGGLHGEADATDPGDGINGLQPMPSGGNGRNGVGSSRSSATNEKSVSGGSMYTSTGDDQSYSATPSGSTSIVGDQQKDDGGVERELEGFSEDIMGADGENVDTKISSYLDSLSLGTGW